MGVSRTTALSRRRRKRKRGGAKQPAWRLALARRGPVRRAVRRGAKQPAWRQLLAPARPGPAARVLRGAKRSPWKLVGLAGIAGVAATGVVVARNRRTPSDLPPDELRERLHARLTDVAADRPPDPPT